MQCIWLNIEPYSDMRQIHKRLTRESVVAVLKKYEGKEIDAKK